MEIKIRHSKKSDVLAIKTIFEQESSYANTLQLPYPSEDMWQQRLDSPPENLYSLVAEINNEIVGQIGLEVYKSPRRKHAANIGMAVSETFRGQGVGSRLLEAIIDLATNWLSIKRIELEVYTDNEAAIALYKKYDFIVEGSAKSYAFKNGGYVDAYFMARHN